MYLYKSESWIDFWCVCKVLRSRHSVLKKGISWTDTEKSTTLLESSGEVRTQGKPLPPRLGRQSSTECNGFPE